jgi:hypothetical protein
VAKGWQLENTTNPDVFGLGQMDLALDSSGHVKELTGRERVRHDVLKGVLTARTNGYGSTAPTLVGKKRQRGFLDVIAASVRTFLDEYRDAQGTLPDDEQIESVRSMNVTEDPSDNSRYMLQISLDMVDGQSIEIEHRL